MKKTIKVLLVLLGLVVAFWVVSTIISTFIREDTRNDSKISVARSEAMAVVSNIRHYCAFSEQTGENLCSSSEAVISNIQEIADIPSSSRILDLKYDAQTNSVKNMVFQYDNNITIVYDGSTYTVK